MASSASDGRQITQHLARSIEPRRSKVIGPCRGLGLFALPHGHAVDGLEIRLQIGIGALLDLLAAILAGLIFLIFFLLRDDSPLPEPIIPTEPPTAPETL